MSSPDEIIEPLKEIQAGSEITANTSGAAQPDETVEAESKSMADLKASHPQIAPDENEQTLSADSHGRPHNPETETHSAQIIATDENRKKELIDDAVEEAAPEEPVKEETMASGDNASEQHVADNLKSEKKPTADGGVVRREKTLANKPKHQIQKKGIANSSAFTKKWVGLVLFCIVVVAIFLVSRPSLIGPRNALNSNVTESLQATATEPALQKPVQPPEPPSKLQLCGRLLDEIAGLRNELAEKKAEIDELKLTYQSGIADMEEQIAATMQRDGIQTYAQARENKRIELSLRMIQRRESYIQKLEKPEKWINVGSEALLYLKRKTEFELQLLDIAEGIDLDKHMRHLDAALQKYRPSADKLSVDAVEENLRPMEAIWERVMHQKETAVESSATLADKAVFEEICSGKLERMGEISTLSIEAAKCIAELSDGSLFLNGLKRITPAAAKYLFRWRGSWICLNGLKELSPEVARHLFQWDGDWISLNGLVELPPEQARYLLAWKGSQIELMGLNLNQKRVHQRTLKYLAQWEAAGGKLFVPDDLKKEIHREGTQRF